MKLQPRKYKYLKTHKGKATNRILSKNNYNQFTTGSIALKTLVHYRLTGRQIEILYITLNKFLKKTGTIIIPLFPQTSVSKKPNEIRMGKGKGGVDHWACKILPGTIICEIETSNIKQALKAISYAKIRLPLKVKTILL